jgi:hypothetical protein
MITHIIMVYFNYLLTYSVDKIEKCGLEKGLGCDGDSLF